MTSRFYRTLEMAVVIAVVFIFVEFVRGHNIPDLLHVFFVTGPAAALGQAAIYLSARNEEPRRSLRDRYLATMGMFVIFVIAYLSISPSAPVWWHPFLVVLMIALLVMYMAAHFYSSRENREASKRED